MSYTPLCPTSFSSNLNMEQPHVQGVAAVWAQQGREELLDVQGQEGQPRPR